MQLLDVSVGCVVGCEGRQMQDRGSESCCCCTYGCM